MQPKSPESVRISAIRQTLAKARPRGAHGQFAKKEPDKSIVDPPPPNPFFSVSHSNPTPFKDPPLVDVGLKVTNPITYLKNWFRKLIGNEAITIKVKTVTVIIIAMILASGGITFGLVKYITSTAPIVKYIPSFASTPQKESALSGTLVQTNGNYYLVSSIDSVINLKISPTTNIIPFLGNRVLITGMFNEDTKTLTVTNIQNLEASAI